MAHKTLVDGTSYEISGGKTLVDGTAYSIKNGKTLVGGTAYEVGFGLKLDVPEGMYLTFSSAESFTIAVNNATKYWDGELYYSIDTAEWSKWDGSTAVASAADHGEQRLYLCGAGNSIISNYSGKWIIDGNNVKCNGNIECLLDYEAVANGIHPVMAEYCYGNMFRDCIALTIAPSLPATNLSGGCYSTMFKGCTALTTATSLPATTLANNCYSFMFEGCTALTTVPSLPATKLTNYCYYYMFYGCKKIKLSSTATDTYTKAFRIPNSGTGTTANSALIYMFGSTGGTSESTPKINTTYYLDSSNTIV